mgnify:CR=1 FL=1
MIIPNPTTPISSDLDAGLSISLTNPVIDTTPTVTNGGVGEVAEHLTDPDHSSTFTSSGGTLSVSFGAIANISYVAVSGHTSTNAGSATIQVFNGATLIDAVALTRNNNVMFTFAEMSFTDLIVKFVPSQVNSLITVSYIAAGQYMSIAKGEQAGYSRLWLNRSLTQSTSSNFQTSPTAQVQKNKALKGMLSLPNELSTFAEATWQTFNDFSLSQPFFIKEAASKPQSSYICYNPISGVKAHPLNRALDAITLKFNAYNGL